MLNLTPGARLREDLVLLRPLGEGAMGEVWAARHLGLSIDVAVKFLSELPVDERSEGLARFEREARAAAQVKSAHIVQIHDTGRYNGVPYIVMELLEGETLRERLARSGLLPLRDVRLVATQLAKGLEAAHRAGFVHRDIKPENVFLTHSATGVVVKILDFGVAKDTALPKIQRLTDQGTMLGTPRYMSPEQVTDSGRVDASADRWAFAVIVYEMLTGRQPFSGAHIGELVVSLLKGDYTPPTALRSELLPAIDGWFKRAFARHTGDRFETTLSMAKMLLRAAPPSPDELEEVMIGTGEFALPAVAVEATRRNAATVRSQPKSVPAPAMPADGAQPTFSGSASSVAPSPEALRRRRTMLALVAIGSGLVAGAVVLSLLVATNRSNAAPPASAVASSAPSTTPPSAPARVTASASVAPASSPAPSNPVAAPVSAEPPAASSAPRRPAASGRAPYDSPGF